MVAKLEINMLEGSIWDKVLKFAIPLAMTSIMQQLFNAADVAIVGQFVGKEALAAVGANGIVINLMLNLMVGLNGFTLCCGIICQELNGTDYLAVPYREDRDNQNAKMEIGYIIPKNTQPDEITQIFIQEMEKYLESAKKALP